MTKDEFFNLLSKEVKKTLTIPAKELKNLSFGSTISSTIFILSPSAIKLFEIDDIDEILAYITAQCDILKERIKYSDLPEKVDENLINQTILNIYADLYNIKF